MHIKRKLAALMTATIMLAQPALAKEKLTVFWPSPMHEDLQKFLETWRQKVEADSNNTVEIDIKANGPLANFGNVIDRVQDDVIQIGIALTNIFPRKFDLTNVVSLPFTVRLDDADQASAAVWRLYKAGMFKSEYQTIVPLFMGVSKQSGFHFAKAPSSLDHLDGLKMRIFNNNQIPMVKSLGMTPVSLPPPDVYEALQRGTIDGQITSWTTFAYFSLCDVLKYHVDLPLGGSVLEGFMSRKKYDSLPASVRKAIDMNANEAMSRAFGKVLLEDADDGKKACAGQPIVQLTPEKAAEWKKKFGDGMIVEWEKANAPEGAKVLTAFKKVYASVLAGQ